MVKCIADWLDLTIKQYDDGTYEAYEALADKSRSGDWATVRRWVESQLDSIEESNASD